MVVIHGLGVKYLQNKDVGVYVDCILVHSLWDYGSIANLYILCPCVVFVGVRSLSHMWKPVVIMLLIQSLFLTNSILLVAFLFNVFIVIVYFGFMIHFPFLLHSYNLTMDLVHGFLFDTISCLHVISSIYCYIISFACANKGPYCYSTLSTTCPKHQQRLCRSVLFMSNGNLISIRIPFCGCFFILGNLITCCLALA